MITGMCEQKFQDKDSAIPLSFSTVSDVLSITYPQCTDYWWHNLFRGATCKYVLLITFLSKKRFSLRHSVLGFLQFLRKLVLSLSHFLRDAFFCFLHFL